MTSENVNQLVATPEMCQYCFSFLLFELLRESKDQNLTVLSTKIQELQTTIPTNVDCPLFVTWEKESSSGEYGLRGCIGTLSPRKLRTALGEYVYSSAFRDRRFHPVSINEVAHLRVAVSLLVKYEDCEDCYDWDVGVHGIIIKFHKGTDFSATFLPEVAAQQNWTREETVESLVQKSGYRGPIDKDLLSTIHCVRYQSSKQKLTYQEYMTCIGYDPIQTSQQMKQESNDGKGWLRYFKAGV